MGRKPRSAGFNEVRGGCEQSASISISPLKFRSRGSSAPSGSIQRHGPDASGLGRRQGCRDTPSSFRSMQLSHSARSALSYAARASASSANTAGIAGAFSSVRTVDSTQTIAFIFISSSVAQRRTIALVLCGSQGLVGLYKSHRPTLTLTAAPGRGSHARQSLWFESGDETVPVLAVRRNSKTDADRHVV
jgi:hypothetical protein